MAQASQNQLRSPREHQMGRISVDFRVPCVLEVVNLGKTQYCLVDDSKSQKVLKSNQITKGKLMRHSTVLDN